MIDHQLGRIFVELPRQTPRLGIVAVPRSRRRNRENRRFDTGAVHLFDRLRRRPVEQRMLARFLRNDFRSKTWGHVMMVSVDTIACAWRDRIFRIDWHAGVSCSAPDQNAMSR